MSRNHAKIGKGLSLSPVASRPSDPENGDLIYNSTNAQFEKYEGGIWKTLGSSSGGSSGVVNLIANGSADDASVSIFTPYLDSGSRPIDGIGAAGAGGTTSITSTNPLTGTKSYLLTKPAGNYQSHGWSVDNIALDLSYRTKVLKISVDYIVNSGTFVSGSSTTDSDIIWSCYDITNSKIVEPSNIKMFSNSSAISDKFEATVQFDSTCTSFRLIAHVATTSALAYELKVDNVAVSPSAYVYGTPITDFGLPIVHTSNVTTNATLTTKTRRVGDSYHVIGNIAFSGTNTQNVTPSITLPYGLDSSKLPSTGRIAVGQFTIRNGGTGAVTSGSLIVSVASFGNIVAFEGVNPSLNSPYTIGANHEYGFEFTIPVVGLSSSVQMSDSADTRVVAAKYSISSTQSITDNTPVTIVWNTTASGGYDTHGSMNTTNGRYTFTSAGKYRFSAGFGTSTSIAIVSGNRAALFYSISGGTDKRIGFLPFSGSVTEGVQLAGSDSVDVVAGDYIEIKAFLDFGSASYNIASSAGSITYFSVEKIQGPNAIASNETIQALYNLTASQVMPHNASTNLLYTTKIYDTHGIYNIATGVITAPIAGYYEITAKTRASIGAGVSFTHQLTVTSTGLGGGVSVENAGVSPAGFATFPTTVNPCVIYLLAGQTATPNFYHFNSASASSTIQTSQLSIKKVG